MCLHPQPVDPIPEQTARIARAAFLKPTTAMTVRDELGPMFSDEQFAKLFPVRGKPAFSPWRLALVTVLQFAENLSDRQAANAVRGRIDWKYCLSLDLTDTGFDSSVLCEFRKRLEDDAAELMVLDTMLEHFRELGLLKARGRQRTDSTHVLANVRRLNRLELVGETMRRALNALADAVPEWLRAHADPEWAERYALPSDDRRLPRGKEKRAEEARKIGVDGFELLEAVFEPETPPWLGRLPEVQTLRKVWLQNYLSTAEDDVCWRGKEEGFPQAAKRIDSPTDPEARYKTKRSTTWLGYKIHITETCEKGLPRLITNVFTEPASASDTGAVNSIHESLEARGLSPATNVVDMGYMDANLVLSSRNRHDVDLLGPMRSDYEWQARERTGFDLANFELDWEKMEARCPEGKKSISWSYETKRERQVLRFAFSSTDCRVCPSRHLCISNPERRWSHRTLMISSKEHYEALRLARERETTADYAEEYAHRDGIEGTVSRGVRAHGLRRTRYRGLSRVHLGHSLTTAAVNFVRVGEWLGGMSKPRRRTSAFGRLMVA